MFNKDTSTSESFALNEYDDSRMLSFTAALSAGDKGPVLIGQQAGVDILTLFGQYDAMITQGGMASLHRMQVRFINVLALKLSYFG